jgi:hypothetical protein
MQTQCDDIPKRVLPTMLPSLVFLAAAALNSGRPSAQATSSGKSVGQSETALDQHVRLLRGNVRSQVKEIIDANLKLTNTEATKFWPIYDRYTADLSKINDQRYGLIKEYAEHWSKMTDDQALSLSQRSLALEQQVAELRATYLVTFSQVLPGAKVATFFQLDRRIQGIIDLQLASQLPLVEEQN